MAIECTDPHNQRPSLLSSIKAALMGAASVAKAAVAAAPALAERFQYAPLQFV
ncbi:hypothetical protein AGABI1DRAFT_82551 [Agaricus bisporus var. burnettii JB137-S8]|uniref:Uncharacterized protein n=1 Tax=Agaricus bisporus var. burnettii (strain JB137-S8 / ATCC MYA-4627 / FGSC 10392) TaxID=597362 RepID=K5W7J7_AGABU|nr:uncharacterized protein AGABI1DRAFT_82551 [Agaricus bisporus var. burnettii JB137-S8]EKM82824.1 hypothetical protein AGABI1DRAFT_82551 [Agaricus bisporus var. burnettii JB137-S8]